MDKHAMYRLAGRDLGTRFAIGSLQSDLDKTAEADEQLVSEVDAAIEAIVFSDELNKVAHNAGAMSAFSQVLEQIEQGTPIEKIAEQLTEALEAKVASASFPFPDSDDELVALQDEMVKGAAEAIGSIAGVDPASDEVLDTAIALVAESLEQQS